MLTFNRINRQPTVEGWVSIGTTTIDYRNVLMVLELGDPNVTGLILNNGMTIYVSHSYADVMAAMALAAS